MYNNYNMKNRNAKTVLKTNLTFTSALIAKTVARINEEFENQGNGATIKHKNGNSYNIWCQNTGSYQITDQLSIWEEETFCKTVPTIEDLARVILSI